jgi:catechol 2,3-dioxygenase-like lactoylglutathione lyase family enzyme
VDLALVILAVSDVVGSRRFYQLALGWDLVVEDPVYVELRSAGGMRLGLYQRASFALNTQAPAPAAGPAGSVTGTDRYFRMDHPEQAIDRLLDVGAHLLSDLADREWGDRAAYLRDPDGNVVVVAQHPQVAPPQPVVPEGRRLP